jgi:PAS domain S-box-containing protein
VAELEKKEARYQQAEKALRISEECLRMLFEHAPDAYYLIDLQGIFVDVNKAAEQMVGYRRDELMGKYLLELGIVSPARIEKATRLLAGNVLGQLSGPDEVIVTRKDGEKVITPKVNRLNVAGNTGYPRSKSRLLQITISMNHTARF